MKTEDLKAFGLEQEVIDKVFALNGKDVEAEKAKTKKAENERDNYKTQLDTAKEALSKFDGVNVDDLKGQITKLQGDLKAKDEEYAAKEAERTFKRRYPEQSRRQAGKTPKQLLPCLIWML